MTREIVTRSNGTFLVEDGRVTDSAIPPMGEAELGERIALRRAGKLTPEESTILDRLGGGPGLTRDRRLVRGGVQLISHPPTATPPVPPGPDRSVVRQVLLGVAAQALAAAWDPTVHLQESVRSMGELDHILNLIGERLSSWSSRDVRGPEYGEGESVPKLARALVEGTATSDPALAPADPAVAQARAAVAGLYLEVERSRDRLERALNEAVPRLLPNLSSLLGPLLAARILSQAGGVERLSRLPASTIQVLGAERAFFEHLRGRGPPPRHGLLFLHADIQGRPRRERGRTARALAGKVAIAARLDASGSGLRPGIAEQFRARSAAIRSTSAKKKKTRTPPE